MAWDFSFDTQTGDTIPDGKGGIMLTHGADTQVYLQMKSRFAAWWGDPSAGTKDFKAIGDNPSAIQAEYARSLGVLAARGVIGNVTATAERAADVLGRIRLMTTSRDSRTGRTIKMEAPR